MYVCDRARNLSDFRAWYQVAYFLGGTERQRLFWPCYCSQQIQLNVVVGFNNFRRHERLKVSVLAI